MSKIKIALAVNVIIYFVIIQAFIRGAISILVDPNGNEMITMYFVMQIAVAVYCIICIIGLLLKKNWGRACTLSWNICLAIILGVVPVASSYVFLSKCEGNIFEVFSNTNIIVAFLASITLVFLSFVFSRENAKVYFTN